jgi:hypothetical protein
MISLSGLDLAFLKANPLPKKRGRPKKKAVLPNNRSDLPAPMVMADIKPFISPVGEKPSLISSRKHLRDHERAYNMHQVGNDFGVGTIAAKNEAKLKAREDLAKGVESGWA